MEFIPGMYQHFKGGIYEALFLAHDSEEYEKQVVVYKNAKGEYFVRPLAMWSEHIERDGYSGPRFVKIEDAKIR
jgi:hypothetical protein